MDNLTILEEQLQYLIEQKYELMESNQVHEIEKISAEINKLISKISGLKNKSF